MRKQKVFRDDGFNAAGLGQMKEQGNGIDKQE